MLNSFSDNNIKKQRKQEIIGAANRDNQAKVSVIIPVYNVEEYLEECLDSVLNQTLKDIEIICVDDGSSDSSLEILREYEKKDGRLTVLSKQNGGAGAARNIGLKKASGKYLSFLDSDDFFEADMLEKAVEKIENDNADFVVFRSDQYLNDKNEFKQVKYTLRFETIPPYSPFSYRQLTDNVFKTFVGWAWDKLYRKEFIDRYELTFQEQRTSNDLRFVFSALVLAKRISCIPDVLAHQRRNNDASLSNTREKSWFCFYDALTDLKKNLISYGKYKELERDFINYALHFSLWNLNTITGECYYKLYDKLKDEWLFELGVMDKAEDYFYNKKELSQLMEIKKATADEFKTYMEDRKK